MLDRIEQLISEAESLIPYMDSVGNDALIASRGDGVDASMPGRVAVDRVRAVVGGTGRLRSVVESKSEADRAKLAPEVRAMETVLETAIKVVRHGFDLAARNDLGMGGRPGDHLPTT